MGSLYHDKSPYISKEIHLASKNWNPLWDISVSYDGTMITTGRVSDASGTVLVIDSIRGAKIRTIPVTGFIYEALITPDGKKIIITTFDDMINIWSVGPPDVLLHALCYTRNSLNTLGHVIISNESKRAFSFTQEYFDLVVDLDDGVISKRLGVFIGRYKGLILSRDDEILFVLSDGPCDKITLFDAENGKMLSTHYFSGHISHMYHTNSPDELFLPDCAGYLVLTGWEKHKIWNYKTDERSSHALLSDLRKDYRLISTLDLEKIVYFHSNKGLILKAIGAGEICIGPKRPEKPRYKFSGDGNTLWVRDNHTIRMYDMKLLSFWSWSTRLEFKGNLGRCIRLLYKANEILWHRNKRPRTRIVLGELPREIICHIFSFLTRES